MIQIKKELKSGGIKKRCKRERESRLQIRSGKPDSVLLHAIARLCSHPPPLPLPRLPDLQEVGICTVQRSSDDSSVEVPMKS